MRHSRFYRCLPLLLLLSAVTALADAGSGPAPWPLALYHPGVDPSHYWVRERLRGVRAYWTGRRLENAEGVPIAVPAGFTRGFPHRALDGKLWMGRHGYSRLLGLLHRRVPEAREWTTVLFMALDLPGHPGPFKTRLPALRRLTEGLTAPHLRVPPHIRITDRHALREQLRQILKAGGAGLMLHRDEALYRHPAPDDLLEMRPFRRGQGQVVAVIHARGHGSTRMLGLLLRGHGDHLFRLTEGFSEAQRDHPPPIGSIVAYKFYGYTRDGRPRFMRFLKVNEEGPGVIH